MIGSETCDFCGCDLCEVVNYPAFDEDDPSLESINACYSCAYDMGLDWPNSEEPDYDDGDMLESR